MKRALIGAVAALLLLAAPARADVIKVTTTDDSSTCNATTCGLRGAIAIATGTDEIDVPAGDYIVNSALTVNSSQHGLIIVGAGADVTTLHGQGKDRILALSAKGALGLQGMTFTHGRAQGTNSFGGLISVSSAVLTMNHMRLTDGQAQRGGAIGSSASQVSIDRSLIDNNTVVAGGSSLNDGGGISQFGGGSLQLTSSTVFNNTAPGEGGGIAASDTDSAVTLTRVTVAGNTSTQSGGGIAYYNSAPSPQVTGSLFAHNIGQTTRMGGLGLSNCAPAVTDLGGNVETGTTCGFTTGIQNASDGVVATALTTEGGHVPVLAIPADSQARDAGGACTSTDQRDAARPNGVACDAGAYEFVPPPVVVQATPTPTPTVAPVVTATPTPAPTPQFHQTVVIGKISGTVKVKLPGTSTYVDLAVTKTIPLKSTVDVRHGKVELTSVPKAGGKPETAVFYDGIFKVTQVGKITDLALVEPLAACPKGGAQAAAKKPKTRRLWGSGKGNFRTTGKYSAATIRGTTWLVQDSCAGTLTKVTQGVVSVRDNVKHKTLLVKAHHQYVAKPKR